MRKKVVKKRKKHLYIYTVDSVSDIHNSLIDYLIDNREKLSKPMILIAHLGIQKDHFVYLLGNYATLKKINEIAENTLVVQSQTFLISPEVTKELDFISHKIKEHEFDLKSMYV